MSDKKISQLTALTQADGADLFPIVDTSVLETKSITVAALMASPGPIGIFTPDIGEFTSLQLPAGSIINEFSIDGTLVGNSDTAVPTEKAVKTYVDAQISSVSSIISNNSFVRVVDDGTSPAYVEIVIDGTQVAYFDALPSTQRLGKNDESKILVSDNDIKFYAGTSPTLQGTFNGSGLSLFSGATINEFSTDITLSGNSDTTIPTEKAIKTYVDNTIQQADINIRAVSSDTTADSNDLILVDTTAGDVQIELQNILKAKINIKKITTDLNKVIVTSSVGKIDNENQILIEEAYQAYYFVSDGNNFYVF